MKTINKKYLEPDYEATLEELEDDEFSIGQCYEEEPAKKLRCRLCNSTHFIVGQGSHFTAIKCVNCQWEMCIHSG